MPADQQPLGAERTSVGFVSGFAQETESSNDPISAEFDRAELDHAELDRIKPLALPSYEVAAEIFAQIFQMQVWRSPLLQAFAQPSIVPLNDQWQWSPDLLPGFSPEFLPNLTSTLSPDFFSEPLDALQAEAAQAEWLETSVTEAWTAALTTAAASIAALPGTIVEIIPQILPIESSNEQSLHTQHLNTQNLNTQKLAQCLALQNLIQPQICHKSDWIGGLQRLWAQLFSLPVALCWSAHGLSLSALKLTARVQVLPTAIASGWLTATPERVLIVSTWGLPGIYTTGLIEPDWVDLELASGGVRSRHIGQKPVCQTWGFSENFIKNATDSPTPIRAERISHQTYSAPALSSRSPSQQQSQHRSPLHFQPLKIEQQTQLSLTPQQVATLWQWGRLLVDRYPPHTAISWLLSPRSRPFPSSVNELPNDPANQPAHDSDHDSDHSANWLSQTAALPDRAAPQTLSELSRSSARSSSGEHPVTEIAALPTQAGAWQFWQRDILPDLADCEPISSLLTLLQSSFASVSPAIEVNLSEIPPDRSPEPETPETPTAMTQEASGMANPDEPNPDEPNPNEVKQNPDRQTWHGQSASFQLEISVITGIAWILPDLLENSLETANCCQNAIATQHLAGKIWVCQTLPEDYYPLLPIAAGVIFEARSTTNHGVLLARDFKLPVVVGVANVCQELRSGDRVTLNAITGQIDQLASPSPSPLASPLASLPPASPPPDRLAEFAQADQTEQVDPTIPPVSPSSTGVDSSPCHHPTFAASIAMSVNAYSHPLAPPDSPDRANVSDRANQTNRADRTNPTHTNPTRISPTDPPDFSSFSELALTSAEALTPQTPHPQTSPPQTPPLLDTVPPNSAPPVSGDRGVGDRGVSPTSVNLIQPLGNQVPVNQTTPLPQLPPLPPPPRHLRTLPGSVPPSGRSPIVPSSTPRSSTPRSTSQPIPTSQTPTPQPPIVAVTPANIPAGIPTNIPTNAPVTVQRLWFQTKLRVNINQLQTYTAPTTSPKLSPNAPPIVSPIVSPAYPQNYAPISQQIPPLFHGSAGHVGYPVPSSNTPPGANSIYLVDGIGLLRSEMLAFSDRLELHRQPNVVTQGLWRGWLQEQLLAGLALYPSRPLLYRLFDRLHPTVALRDRGVQLYIQQPELLDLQLDVIAHLRSQGADQLHLLLPFVRNLDEFDFCWRRIEGMGLLDDPSLAVWMMAEVPSMLLLLDRYLARGVRGVSIGMNDLAALLLGWDREQDDSRAFTNLAEPALVEAIEQIAQTAKLHQVQCQLCSDLIADYPQTLQRALLAGVTAISVSADRLDQTALAIAEVEQQLGWAHSLPPIAPHTPFACDLAKHRSHLHPTQRPPGLFP